MSELKPCPFCGKVDDLYSIPRYLQVTKEETKEIEWAVGCKRCDVHLYRARYAKDDGIATWNTRPIEDALRAELARLLEKLHDEMSQLEIATDLGNKRYIALNQIYEDGEKHNANWCKRKAQEGLGIKNA